MPGALITIKENIEPISKDVTLPNSVQKSIAKHYPDLTVVGNQVPDHYIPMKGEGSKFYNPYTKKCVVFPGIGSFEIFFRGRLIFSKKKRNAWPDFSEIN